MRALRACGALIAAVSAMAVGGGRVMADLLPNPHAGDPVLDGDPIDWRTGLAASIVPGAPWILTFSNSHYTVPAIRGDVDLVVRVGHPGTGSTLPDPGPPAQGLSGAFGRGFPIAFSVYLSDGSEASPQGLPAEPSYLDGLPFLVLAFADLDGDGFVGITHLDGDSGDAAIERAELTPVGRRYALGRHGVAEGVLTVEVGGMPEPARVALTAVALAGAFEDPELQCAGCHAWEGSEAWQVLPMEMDLRSVDPYPKGPAVMTKLPFQPATDPQLVFPDMPFERMAAHPNARVGARAVVAVEPDPGDPAIGEAFTLPLDGSEPTIGVARLYSGPPTRFALARVPDPSGITLDASHWLRPTLRDGKRAPLEIVTALSLGTSESARARVVALDVLGNVARPPEVRGGSVVSLRTGGTVEIESPDSDGDPHRETVTLPSAYGVEIRLRAGSGPAQDVLLLEGNGLLGTVDLVVAPSDDEPEDEPDDD